MKVKIISSGFMASLENQINEFIKDKQVIDIKYQAVCYTERGQNKIIDRAVILYEEGDQNG